MLQDFLKLYSRSARSLPKTDAALMQRPFLHLNYSVVKLSK